MKKKNKTVSKNYLEKKPMRKNGLEWTEKDGLVTLNIYNKGVFKKITQVLLKKPKISYVHLDELGSFVWPLLDGEKDIMAIGEAVKERFAEKAEPLYTRLAKYFQILDSYGFVQWNEQKDK